MLQQYQQDFITAMLAGKSVPNLTNPNFTTDEVLRIYYNNYFTSITEALGATYGCVKRLVGESFFNYICQEFILAHPPQSGNIIEYGKELSQFLSTFKAVKDLPYLVDVATFEYCYERVYHYPDKSYLIYSPYAVIDIWQLDESSEQITLNKPTYIKIIYHNLEVQVYELNHNEYLKEAEGENSTYHIL